MAWNMKKAKELEPEKIEGHYFLDLVPELTLME
jgi:hypothetical protein